MVSKNKFLPFIISLGVNLIILIVVLLGFATISYGWFAKNYKTTAGGMNISVDFDDTVATYYTYKYNTVTESGSKYSKDENNQDVLNTITNLSMANYDTVFLERNKLNSIVIRISITGSKLQQNGTITINLERSNQEEFSTSTLAYTRVENNVTSNYAYISSCVHFKAAAISSNNVYLGENENEDEIWKQAKNVFENINAKTLFISCEEEEENNETVRTYSVIDSISLDVNYTSADWIDTNDDNVVDTLNIYFFIDYDVDFVEYVYEDSGINESGSISQITLSLINDFTRITVKHN